MSWSRREALIALVGSGAAAGFAGWQGWPVATDLKEDPPPSPFNKAHRAALAAAAERILPGALEAGVPEYIDYWMVRAPWSGFLKAGFEKGAVWLDRLAKREHQQAFVRLSEEAQDAILQRFQRGEVGAANFTGRAFFEYLVQFTLEGFLSDPRYGGNKDEAGWKLIEHEHCFWAPK